MKRYDFLFCLSLLFATSLGNLRYGSPIRRRNEIEENPVQRNYIKKYSDSWRSFAVANDIAKREKLKKALSDALHSIDYKRKSDVATPPINLGALERIKKAAALWKEFRQIHDLSENVKRTLEKYKSAKKNLSEVVNSGNGNLDILKRFLVARTKRNRIENAQNRSSNVKEKFDDLVIDKPHYIKHTPKLSLIATPINGTGKIGVEYISIDPKTSSIERANKAFRAAKILLKYAAEKRANKAEHLDRMIDSMRRDIEGFYSNREEEKKKKSLFPNKANLFLNNEYTKVDIPEQHGLSYVTSDSINQELDSTEKAKQPTESPSKKSKTVKTNEKLETFTEPIEKPLDSSKADKSDAAKTTSQGSDLNSKNETFSKETILSEKDFPAAEDSNINPSDETKINLGTDSLNSNKKEDRQSVFQNVNKTVETNTTNTNSNMSTIANKEKQKSEAKMRSMSKTMSDEDLKSNTTTTKDKTTQEKSEHERKSVSGQDAHSSIKQQETLKRLKEAKLARQKYELARHELAQKVRELYKMANEYEKEDTANQILEVKNDVVPKIPDLTPELETHGIQTKRDDSHPGVALSGVSNHAVKGIITANPDDGSHKGFTMGAIDKREHQVSLDETENHDVIGVKKQFDLSLPSNVKIEELKDDIGNHMKSQEETLKVIAQSIKEDLNGISSTDKKKKILAAAMSNTGEKKNSQANEKIDEYLTKALADIMGSESTAGSEAGKEVEMKQKERESEQGKTQEENMRIVEEAMRTHAKHPDLPLPLVSTNGDKMVLNKNTKDTPNDAQNRNGVESGSSDHKFVQPLNLKDPSSKALLDKASHMEEQVAAQQDQLYNSENTEQNKKAPDVAKPNIDPSPQGPPQPSYPVHSNHDPYGSIKETHDSPSEGQIPPSMDEDSEEDDDDDDDDYEPHQRHHREHHDDDDYDDEDEDEDDDGYDDEDADKRTHVRYHDEQPGKRSFKSVLPGIVSTSKEKSLPEPTSSQLLSDDDVKATEELMDVKKSKIMNKEVVLTEAEFPQPMYP